MWIIVFWIFTGYVTPPEYVKLDNVYRYETCDAYGKKWAEQHPDGGYACFETKLPQSFKNAKHDPLVQEPAKKAK